MLVKSLSAIALAMSLSQSGWSQCGPSGCYSASPPSRQSVALPAAVQRATASVVRIVHEEASGASLGSGALVAISRDASWVLTCAHLFTEAGRTRVVLAGQTSVGRVVAIDREHDLALVRTEPLRGRPILIGEVEQQGELIACGFGGQGVLRAIRGRITGYATARGASAPSLRIRGAVRSGDSGGPVFDLRGRLVAVIWGQRAGETYAMSGGPFKRILARLPRSDRSLKPVERRPVEKPAERPVVKDDPWKQRIERRLDQLASRPAPPAVEIPRDLARRGDLSDLSARWDQRFERLRGEVNQNAAAAPPSTSPSVTTNVLTGLGRWGLSETLFAAGVGAVPVAALMFGMRWRSHRRRKRSAITRHSEPQTVAVDSPPPPQQVVPETHFVSYERDQFARAHQWASEQLVRKFPGAVEMLSSLDSLIRQKLNGTD